MLVFSVTPGHEILVRHRSGSTMFARLLYSSLHDEARLGVTQAHSDFLVYELDREHDLGRFRIVHRKSREVATVMISRPRNSRRAVCRLDIVCDDAARNFEFLRPELWKQKFLSMITENAA